MEYISLNKNAADVSFKEAVIRGLAPDRGLYYPKTITPLDASFFAAIEQMDNPEIAFQVIRQFVGNDISDEKLKQLLEEVLNFDFPLVEVEDNILSMELFHGPTMAFKDVGARFMARCLGHFNTDIQEKITVLVATSGDTGGAVASGFFKVPGIEVVILYPKGKVSDIQEKQLTTLGANITAIEVDGVFDDCQTMVKTAFLDKELEKSKKLTSANSINVARWLPQMFYYFFAYKQLKARNKKLVFSVPSGNFGNICAGMMAHKIGLPVHHFVTGTNANDVVPQFLKTGYYEPKPSVATISNAMDVGAPSNFIRIRQLYDNDFKALQKQLSGYSYSDAQTKQALNHLFFEKNYIADPHGAIGYLALKQYMDTCPDCLGVFMETAHPLKFLDVIPDDIVPHIEINQQIQQLLSKEKRSHQISTYEQLKDYLLG